MGTITISRKAIPKPQNIAPSYDEKKEKEENAARIKAALEDWSQSAECLGGLPKEFPSSLTAYERLVVHQWAEEHGFQHKSAGESHNRRIIVKTCLEKKGETDNAASLSDPASTLTTTNSSPIQALEDSGKLDDDLEKLEINCSIKKKKNKKPRMQASAEPAVEQSEGNHKTSPVKIPASANYHTTQIDESKCPICQKCVPKQNLSLHQLRCKEPQEPAVRPKQKHLVKPLPLEPKTTKGQKKEDDVESVLSEFRQMNNVCNFSTCQTGISLLGQLCSHCNRRFCLSHHLPEIHGCGDAVRRQARSMTIKQGFISAGSQPSKPKTIDAAKRAHLQRRLDQKIQDMSTKRAGTQENSKKK